MPCVIQKKFVLDNITVITQEALVSFNVPLSIKSFLQSVQYSAERLCIISLFMSPGQYTLCKYNVLRRVSE